MSNEFQPKVACGMIISGKKERSNFDGFDFQQNKLAESGELKIFPKLDAGLIPEIGTKCEQSETFFGQDLLIRTKTNRNYGNE